MDWSDYPKGAISNETVLSSIPALAIFLDATEPPTATINLLNLLEQAQLDGLPLVADGIATTYPREVLAWRTWRLISTPSVGDLLAALEAIPDPVEPVDPAQLVRVTMTRQISTTGSDGMTNYSIKYRQDTFSPDVQAQFFTDAMVCEMDPAIFTDTSNVAVHLRFLVNTGTLA